MGRACALPLGSGVFCVTSYLYILRARRALSACVVGACGLFLASCAGQQVQQQSGPRGFSPSVFGVSASQRVVQQGQAVPRGGGVYRVGRPYTIRGRTYHPAHNPSYDNRGQASWYGDDFHGRRTANGELYDMYALSAAHRTLPLPSYVRVSNPANGRSVVLRVNDRGPYHDNRIIDISKRAAMLLDLRRAGVGNVRVQYVGRAPLDGNDDEWLQTTVRQNGAPMSQTQVAALAPVPDWARQPASGGSVSAVAQRSGAGNAQVAVNEELPRVDQAQAVRQALTDRLTPLPPERPRDQTLQTAALGGLVAPQTPAPVSQQPGPVFSGLMQQVVPTASAAPAPAVVSAGLAGPTATSAPVSLVPQPQPRPGPASLSGFQPPQSLSSVPVSFQGAQVLQVGSFRDAAQARRIGDSLARHGSLNIEQVTIGGLSFHQVRVGPIRDPQAAQGALRDARAAGAPTARLSGS